MLPTDFFYFWWGPNQCNFDEVPCAVIVRINRLFRLPRMWEWFERTETATGYPNAFRICKVSGLGSISIIIIINGSFMSHAHCLLWHYEIYSNWTVIARGIETWKLFDLILKVFFCAKFAKFSHNQHACSLANYTFPSTSPSRDFKWEIAFSKKKKKKIFSRRRMRVKKRKKLFIHSNVGQLRETFFSILYQCPQITRTINLVVKQEISQAA